jgi:hypothetical protein
LTIRSSNTPSSAIGVEQAIPQMPGIVRKSLQTAW